MCAAGFRPATRARRHPVINAFCRRHQPGAETCEQGGPQRHLHVSPDYLDGVAGAAHHGQRAVERLQVTVAGLNVVGPEGPLVTSAR